MTETDRQAWLQLAFTPHIGAESFAVLLQMYGTASAALQAPAEVIAQLGKHAKQAAREWHNTSLARAAAELWLLYGAHQWQYRYGIAHDLLSATLLLIGARYARNPPQRQPENERSEFQRS